MRLGVAAGLAWAVSSQSGAALASVIRSSSSSSDSSTSGTISVTPHDSYSSSVGVLGCMIDTNRVAYWPPSVDCNNLCVKVSYDGRHVYLLRIDQSGGAHDVSYDAWNYLSTGKSASSDPTTGGGIDMTYEDVDMSNCNSLINTSGNKLPLSASNSMDFLASCLAQSDSWVANNYVLYNILDPICTLGYDEVCKLDWPEENQPTCPHTLGLDTPLTSEPVYNIAYGTGEKTLAGAPPSTGVTGTTSDDESAGSVLGSSTWAVYVPAMLTVLVHLTRS